MILNLLVDELVHLDVFLLQFDQLLLIDVLLVLFQLLQICLKHLVQILLKPRLDIHKLVILNPRLGLIIQHGVLHQLSVVKCLELKDKPLGVSDVHGLYQWEHLLVRLLDNWYRFLNFFYLNLGYNFIFN